MMLIHLKEWGSKHSVYSLMCYLKPAVYEYQTTGIKLINTA